MVYYVQDYETTKARRREMFRIFLIMAGVVLIVISVVRHTARRREFGESYTQYVDKIKYRPLSESNEFGQKVKWIVESDEPEGKRTTE